METSDNLMGNTAIIDDLQNHHFESVRDLKFCPKLCKNCFVVFIVLEGKHEDYCKECRGLHVCNFCGFSVKDSTKSNHLDKLHKYDRQDGQVICTTCINNRLQCDYCEAEFYDNSLSAIKYDHGRKSKYYCKRCLPYSNPVRMPSRIEFHLFSDILTKYNQKMPEQTYKEIYDEAMLHFSNLEDRD